MDLEVGTILLDTGQAIRVRRNDVADGSIDRGSRVFVAAVERDGSAYWAKKVERTSTPFEAAPLDLVPNVPPPPEDPKIVEARRKAAAEHRQRAHQMALERRADWSEKIGSETWEQSLARLTRHVESEGLQAVASRVIELARPAIRAIATPVAEVSLAGSRFGGQPSVPVDWSWPRYEGRPLSFLGQLRLEELPRGVMPVELPADGHLLFFYDAEEQPWGFEPTDLGAWRVEYVPSGTQVSLQAPPDDLDDEVAAFDACGLVFGTTLSIPSAFSDSLEGVLDDERPRDAYWELIHKLETDELSVPAHQLGGWPHVIQNDMETQCQLALNGVRQGDASAYQATYRPGLEEGAEDWTLLFQIDSDEEGPGWMWGDVGMLYFWIRKTDLVECDFSKVWLVLQCT